jgi:hypothetical protein
MNVRKYGNTPTYREIAYEILFVNRGKPMYVKDIVDKARKMNMLTLVNSEAASKTATYNTFASKMNTDDRFMRTAENTFGLTTFNQNSYNGHFRQMLSKLKKERRTLAANNNEIQNKESPPPLTSIAMTPRPKNPSACANTSFGANDIRIGRLEQIVQQRCGFEWRLKTTAALRGDDVDCAEKFLQSISTKLNK